MKNIVTAIVTLIVTVLVLPVLGQQLTVSLTKQTGKDGKEVLVLENYRVKLVIDPARGGAVISCSDKLAPAEIVLQKQFKGLCMDHFQSQNWPGEFLESPYTYEVKSQGPDAVSAQVSKVTTGVYGPSGAVEDKKISGLKIDKTYTLRKDSPGLECLVKITAPSSKVFAYWQQNVFFAGGDYDPATDRAFRPSTRGVRSTGQENNSFYGTEDWLRDTTAGWSALIDTEKSTGVATIYDYNELNVNYANCGNYTLEMMFNTCFLPKGSSKEYSIWLVPITGINKMLHASRNFIAGYHMTSDKGKGKIDFFVARSAVGIKNLTFDISIAGAIDGKEIKAGTVTFENISDKITQKDISFTGASEDPLVLRVTAKGSTEIGEDFRESFEDYHNGIYQWGDNIQTDMRTPVYSCNKPEQKIDIRKPAKLNLISKYGMQVLYFEGLLDEEYRVADAVHTTAYVQQSKRIFYSYSVAWLGNLSDFPYDYTELLSYDAVILGGISKSGLKPIGVEMLHDFLIAGGGMIVLGSYGAYGGSELRGTKLGDAFPVEISENSLDIAATGGKPVLQGKDIMPFMDGMEFNEAPFCYYIHQVKVKPDTKVVLETDGKPFLVIGEYGPKKARIACILGAPMGNPKKGETPFWQSSQWYYLLRNLLWWVAREDRHFEYDKK